MPGKKTIARRTVVLTFDDGPGPSTRALLRVLDRYRMRATFFVTGKNLRGNALDGNEELARTIAIEALQAGHLLGNHGDSHARDPLSETAFREEIRTVDALLCALYASANIPVPEPLPFRLPYGPQVRNGRMDERFTVLTSLGKTHQHWTAIFNDWSPEANGSLLAEKLLAHIEEQWASGVHPVITLHDAGAWPQPHGFSREATVEAVETVGARLASQKPEYLTVNELLRSVAR